MEKKGLQEPKTAGYEWQFGNEEIALKVSSYWYGDGIAISMFCKNGNYFDDFSELTVNLPGYHLKTGEGFIADFCSKEKLAFIKQHELGKVLPEKGHSGFCAYAKVAFDLERLAEFDPEGVAQFRELHQLPVKGNKEKKLKTKKRSGMER